MLSKAKSEWGWGAGDKVWMGLASFDLSQFSHMQLFSLLVKPMHLKLQYLRDEEMLHILRSRSNALVLLHLIG